MSAAATIAHDVLIQGTQRNKFKQYHSTQSQLHTQAIGKTLCFGLPFDITQNTLFRSTKSLFSDTTSEQIPQGKRYQRLVRKMLKSSSLSPYLVTVFVHRVTWLDFQLYINRRVFSVTAEIFPYLQRYEYFLFEPFDSAVT